MHPTAMPTGQVLFEIVSPIHYALEEPRKWFHLFWLCICFNKPVLVVLDTRLASALNAGCDS